MRYFIPTLVIIDSHWYMALDEDGTLQFVRHNGAVSPAGPMHGMTQQAEKNVADSHWLELKQRPRGGPL